MTSLLNFLNKFLHTKTKNLKQIEEKLLFACLKWQVHTYLFVLNQSYVLLLANLRELKRYDDSVVVLEKALSILMERYGEVNVVTATC